MSEFLKDVENGKEFLCKDGRVIRNLEELAQIIKEIPFETFFHHVSREKNDFADWIKQAVGDPVLANRINRAKSRTTMNNMVKKRIFELNMY